jgi:hypothetical protein
MNLYDLDRRRRALMDLPPYLPADLIMSLTEGDLDRLYAASTMGRETYYTILERILARTENKRS